MTQFQRPFARRAISWAASDTSSIVEIESASVLKLYLPASSGITAITFEGVVEGTKTGEADTYVVVKQGNVALTTNTDGTAAAYNVVPVELFGGLKKIRIVAQGSVTVTGAYVTFTA